MTKIKKHIPVSSQFPPGGSANSGSPLKSIPAYIKFSTFSY